jgi:hypothetical protein
MSSILPSIFTNLFVSQPPQAHTTEETLNEEMQAFENIEKTVSVKEYIESLASKVNEVIKNTTQLGVDYRNRPLMDVAIRIYGLLQNALNNSSVHKQWVLLSHETKSHYGKLTSLVEQLQRNGMDPMQLDTTVSRVIEPKTPYQESQVTRVSPQYLLKTGQDRVRVSVFGEFPFCHKQTPTLMVQGIEAQIAEMQPNLIDFEIPEEALDPTDQAKGTIYKYVKAAFSAPWESWRSVHRASFTIWFAILPDSPGVVEAKFKAKGAGRIQQSQKREAITAPFSEISIIQATPGWRFVGMPQVVVNESTSPVEISYTQKTDENTLIETFEVSFKSKDQEKGLVHFGVSFDEYREMQQGQERIERINNLMWNTACQFCPASNEQLIGLTLNGFNGRVFSFLPQTNCANPFVNIYEHEGSLVIMGAASNADNANFVNFSEAPITEPDAKKSPSSLLMAALAAYVHTLFNLNRAISELKHSLDTLLKKNNEIDPDRSDENLQSWNARCNLRISEALNPLILRLQQEKELFKGAKVMMQTPIARAEKFVLHCSSLASSPTTEKDEDEKKGL